jgi:hypothetical protein
MRRRPIFAAATQLRETLDKWRREARGKREDVAFLRDSPWMVVIENEKAVDLILCKGY